jgi:hypothetical protein
MNCEYLVKSPDKSKPCVHYLKIKGEGFCSRSDRFVCLEWMKQHAYHISYSALQAWLTCPRKYKYMVIDGIELVPEMIPVAMEMGQDLHHNLNPNLKPSFICSPDLPEYSRVKAILDAMKELEIKDPPDGIYEADISIPLENTNIIGYVDVLYYDFFIERKFTANPDYYTNIHTIASQLGTYFLYNERLKYGIIQAIRTPDLRSTGKYKDEDMDSYYNRTYQDILNRPGHYFPGWDKETKTFGRKFYRHEFDLQSIKERYETIVEQIRWYVQNRREFHKNEQACMANQRCMYLSICETGGVSELLYKYRDKKVSNR